MDSVENYCIRSNGTFSFERDAKFTCLQVNNDAGECEHLDYVLTLSVPNAEEHLANAFERMVVGDAWKWQHYCSKQQIEYGFDVADNEVVMHVKVQKRRCYFTTDNTSGHRERLFHQAVEAFCS